MEELTGIPAETFNNKGSLKEFSVKLQIAELTLSKAGISIDQATITKEVVGCVDNLLSKRLTDEHNQSLLKEKELHKEQIDSLKDSLKEQTTKNAELQKELDEITAQQKYTPSIKGGIAEEDLAKRVRSIAPYDELSLKQRYQGSTDLIAKIKSNQEQVVGKLCIESKEVGKWDDGFIKEAKDHARKEGTENVMIVTNVMPPDAINTNLDCFRDGVWIVPTPSFEFAYASYRHIIETTYRLQQNYDRQLQTIEKEKTIVEQLRSIVVTEAFKKYYQIANDLVKQAEVIDEESRTMLNYVQTKNARYRNVAEAIRNLANTVVDQSAEIQSKIKQSLVT
jgi:hypothetical protein